IGAVDLLCGVAAQLDDARLFFGGYDACGQNVAGLTQAPVGDRTDPTRAASHETADRRAELGRGVHAQFQSRRPRQRVDLLHPGTGLARTESRLVPFDVPQAVDVEQHAAFERTRLTVVAGAAGPHRDWDAQARTRRDHPNDIGFVTRRDQNIGRLAGKLDVED